MTVQLVALFKEDAHKTFKLKNITGFTLTADSMQYRMKDQPGWGNIMWGDEWQFCLIVEE